ncbi:NADH-quinone oxidoreductase subunit NuoE [Naumannella halotolerans]|uniref:NADH-quinone oxidoreductase subunit E n=1 Tax=Naumannella halotolerans TaxID=993414 RepID=A0A4R7JD86_9ACTN|nr:NADH-quinone oxidoreductase subunit NuoE [Naumannella halotolerans]TDT34449.1 NADH-quinone oxidoreductase subunit E [Naumannella halotolerans]
MKFTTYFPESGGYDITGEQRALAPEVIGELEQIADRYPRRRSALLPMLHLCQSVQGRITTEGIEACADILGISTAEVSGVATFYTMYKRKPVGKHLVGVCTTALCAIMGGDELLAQLQAELGIGIDETTADGKITLEQIECNAACDYAPVIMVNWEFFDRMDPVSTDALVEALRSDQPISSTRGAEITSWREAERVLAGFPDGRVDQGPTAGPASLLGVRLAAENGWSAPSPTAVVEADEASEADHG